MENQRMSHVASSGPAGAVPGAGPAAPLGESDLVLIREATIRRKAIKKAAATARGSAVVTLVIGVLAALVVLISPSWRGAAMAVGLCGVGAISLNHAPSVELPTQGDARAPAAAWMADVPAAHAVPSETGAHAPAKTLAATTTPTPVAASNGVLPDGRVILNTATAEELTRLKGVGLKRAKAIIDLRERLGGFKRISSLLRVRGIGVRTLKRLRPFVVLDPPEQEQEREKAREPEQEQEQEQEKAREPEPAPSADGRSETASVSRLRASIR